MVKSSNFEGHYHQIFKWKKYIETFFTPQQCDRCYSVWGETHDVVCHSNCATTDCNAKYTGECVRRLNKHDKDHNGWDRNSQIVKQKIEQGHEPVSDDNFKIIANSFGNNINKRKISEVLMVKRFKGSLSIQEKSVKLQLFN